MRLFTFRLDGRQRLGAESSERLIDLAAAAEAGGTACSPALDDMLSLITAGPDGFGSRASCARHTRLNTHKRRGSATY